MYLSVQKANAEHKKHPAQSFPIVPGAYSPKLQSLCATTGTIGRIKKTAPKNAVKNTVFKKLKPLWNLS